jgi:hypothetical protein
MMEASRRREVEVEVYTGTHYVTGWLSTTEGRLSDTLNYELPHVLGLTDVSRRPLEQPLASAEREGGMHLNTVAIAFAVPRSPEPDLEERMRTRMFEYVEKERHRAVVSLPPFQFEGDLHLPKSNDVERSLWSLTPAFIPLSDAKITLSDHPDVVWQREIVILNRRKAQIMLYHDQYV